MKRKLPLSSFPIRKLGDQATKREMKLGVDEVLEYVM